MYIQYEDFLPTKWDAASKKIRFAEGLKTFISGGFQEKHFPHWLYVRLSMTFGFIAHYDQHGFYWHYFDSDAGKRVFLQQILNWPCYGDPEYTYSDVEKHLQGWLREHLEAKAA